MAEVELARWTWPRLFRVLGAAALTLVAADVALGPLEQRLEDGLAKGEVRNGPGFSVADGTRFMLLELPPGVRRNAVAVSGSSITFGPSLSGSEAIPAQVARSLTESGRRTSILNMAQHGGTPADAVPIAAALEAHPVRALLVELHSEAFVAGPSRTGVDLGAEEEVALFEAASPDGRQMLESAGYWPSVPRRIESALSVGLSRVWRVYRWRSHLWLDDEFTPTLAVWSARRKAAELGVLPKRLQGQTTNVHKLPWRKFYASQPPSPLQRLSFPSPDIDDSQYQILLLVKRLCDRARVPIVLFEVTMNVPFQRQFRLTTEEQIANYFEVRRKLRERARADGFEVIDAEELPEDGFMDKDHLTPLGGELVGARIARQLRAELTAPGAAEP